MFFSSLFSSFCTIGSRITKLPKDGNCSKEFGTDMYFEFCKPKEAEIGQASTKLNSTARAEMHTESDYACDTYFTEHNASWHQVCIHTAYDWNNIGNQKMWAL